MADVSNLNIFYIPSTSNELNLPITDQNIEYFIIENNTFTYNGINYYSENGIVYRDESGGLYSPWAPYGMSIINLNGTYQPLNLKDNSIGPTSNKLFLPSAIPTIDTTLENVFGGALPIGLILYVKDEDYNTYINDPVWSTYSSYFSSMISLETNNINSNTYINGTLSQTNNLIGNILTAQTVLDDVYIVNTNNLESNNILIDSNISTSSVESKWGIKNLLSNSFILSPNIHQEHNLISENEATEVSIDNSYFDQVPQETWDVVYTINNFINVPQQVSIDLNEITSLKLYWGDVTRIETYISNGTVFHTFPGNGTYHLRIWGEANNISFNGSGDFITQVNLSQGVSNYTDLSETLSGCKQLTTFTVPREISTLNSEDFNDCINLSEILVDDNNIKFYDVDGVLFNNNTLIKYPPKKIGTSYTTPDTLITNISDYAFSKNELLETITISDIVTNIGNYTFKDCIGLYSVNSNPIIPPIIGNGAFDNTNQNLLIYVDYQSYDEYVINWNEYSDIISYLSTDQNLFYFDELTQLITGYKEENPVELIFPKFYYINGDKILVKGISDYSFANYTTLETVVFPNTFSIIGEGSLSNTALVNLDIPDSITYIGNNFLINCNSLASIYINNNPLFATIDDVLYNKNITELILYPPAKQAIGFTAPSTITSIRDYCFYNCNNLTYVKISNSTPPSIGSSTFYNYISNFKIKVPYNYIDSYRTQWVNYINIISAYYINENDFVFSNGSISSYTGTETNSLLIPEEINNETVTNILNTTFNINNSFKTVNIPYTITTLEEGTFKDCINLTSIYVDQYNNNYIGINGILYNKSKTTLISYPSKKPGEIFNIPSTVSDISAYAFSNAIYLKNVYNVKNISTGTFIGSGINAIDLLTNTTIPDYAFKDCVNLSNINFQKNITSIGIQSFSGCNSFTNFTIPGTVTVIGDLAFNNCINLVSVKSKNFTPPNIGTTIFNNHNNNLKIFVSYSALNNYKATWADYASIIFRDEGGVLISLFDDEDFIAEVSETDLINSNITLYTLDVNDIKKEDDIIKIYVKKDFNSVKLLDSENIYFKSVNL